MSVGNEGRPSALTSGPCQRPPPLHLSPFLDNAAVVAVVIPHCRVVPPPPPSNWRRYACLAGSSRLTAVAGSALSLSRSSPLPRLSGVPLLPSLTLSSSASPSTGREKMVEDGSVIRPQSRGHCCRCQHGCCHPHAPSSPFCLCCCPGGWPQPIPQHVLWPDLIIIIDRHHCPRQQHRCRAMMTLTASMMRRRYRVLPGMPLMAIVTRL